MLIADAALTNESHAVGTGHGHVHVAGILLIVLHERDYPNSHLANSDCFVRRTASVLGS